MYSNVPQNHQLFLNRGNRVLIFFSTFRLLQVYMPLYQLLRPTLLSFGFRWGVSYSVLRPFIICWLDKDVSSWKVFFSQRLTWGFGGSRIVCFFGTYYVDFFLKRPPQPIANSSTTMYFCRWFWGSSLREKKDKLEGEKRSTTAFLGASHNRRHFHHPSSSRHFRLSFAECMDCFLFTNISLVFMW